MHFTRSLAVIASIALVNAIPLPQDDGSATTSDPSAPATSPAPSSGNSTSNAIKLVSESDFCLFLPPQPGLNVATNEDNGIPFCSNGSNDVPGAQPFPNGFITTAHFQQNDTYQQVTGYMNPSAYQLSSTDQGGQYDNHGNGKPIGASCQGYSYFVSIIEPADSRFCIRCCQNFDDCNSGRSGFGCLRVVPGDYTQADGTQPSTTDSSAPAPSPSSSTAPTDPSSGNTSSGDTSSGDNTSSPADTTNTNEAIHANTDFKSVLDEIPTFHGNDGESTDPSADPSAADPSSGDATTDPTSSGPTSSGPTPTADPSSGDSSTDPSTSDSGAADSGSSSNPVIDSFPAEIAALQGLVTNGTSAQEIQQNFQQYVQSLQTKYPKYTQALQKLLDVTAKFTTTDEWKTFIQKIQDKISAFNEGSVSPPSAPTSTPTGTASDISLPTGASSSLPSSTPSGASDANSGTNDDVHGNVWVAENDADINDPNALGGNAPSTASTSPAPAASAPSGSLPTTTTSDASAPSPTPNSGDDTNTSQPLTADDLDKELNAKFDSFEQKLMDEIRGLIGNKNSDSPNAHSDQATW